PPGRTVAMSFAIVSGFIATTRSMSDGRAFQPSALTRISYHVGSPWMFDGKIFFPVTGMPMRKIDCMSMVLALALPVPLTVPILKAKSLTPDWGLGTGDWIIAHLLRQSQSPVSRPQSPQMRKE